MLIYMLNGKIYYDKAAYEVAERDARQAVQRQRDDAESAARNQFMNLVESQPDGQALYLLGGKFERENDTQKARAVYERVITKFASTEWAVKANDRLLAMRGEADANRRASDTQNELSRNREQAVRLCQNRRTACFSSCSSVRTVSERHSCENACPLCN